MSRGGFSADFGDARTYGQRLRLDLVERGQLVPQRLPLLLLLAFQLLRDSVAVLIHAVIQLPLRLVIHQPLHGVPFFGRRVDGEFDLLRVFIEAVVVDRFDDWRFDPGDLFAYLFSPLLPESQFALVFGLFRLRDQNVVILRACGGEEGLQTIIVLLQDRVVFMIVAARAPDRRTQEDRAYGVSNVVQNLLPTLPQVPRVVFIGVMAVETRGEERVRIPRPQFVARNLLLDEPVVRLVFVERFDHVIAVAPRVRTSLVRFEPLAFRVTSEVQPVARPLLVVMWAAEQPVDNLLERPGRVIGQERVDLFRRRRQAGQIECRAAQQSDLVGGRRRLDAFAFELRQDESVHRSLDPGAISDHRYFRLDHFLISPVVELFGSEREIVRGRPDAACESR